MKFLLSLLVIILSSCSFRNDAFVTLTIDSEPGNAKIYVDGTYYGTTVKEIRLVPDKNHILELRKEGYKIVTHELRTSFTMRIRRAYDKKRCRLDFIGSIFILPYFGLKSVHCRDFSRELYSFELEPDPYYQSRNPQQKQQAPNYLAPQYYQNSYGKQNRNYGASQKPTYRGNQYQDPSPYSAMFNNHSEFANDGKSADSIDNPNRQQNIQKPINYYNWQ
ncbi:MAG: hypothetical protein ACJAW3_000804 [Lentimonas sp.]|jgi:hypothetical protein